MPTPRSIITSILVRSRTRSVSRLRSRIASMANRCTITTIALLYTRADPTLARSLIQPAEPSQPYTHTIRSAVPSARIARPLLHSLSVIGEAHPCLPAKGQGNCAMIPLTPLDTLNRLVSVSPVSEAGLPSALLMLLLLTLLLLLSLASASHKFEFAPAHSAAAIAAIAWLTISSGRSAGRPPAVNAGHPALDRPQT